MNDNRISRFSVSSLGSNWASKCLLPGCRANATLRLGDRPLCEPHAWDVLAENLGEAVVLGREQRTEYVVSY